MLPSRKGALPSNFKPISRGERKNPPIDLDRISKDSLTSQRAPLSMWLKEEAFLSLIDVNRASAAPHTGGTARGSIECPKPNPPNHKNQLGAFSADCGFVICIVVLNRRRYRAASSPLDCQLVLVNGRENARGSI